MDRRVATLTSTHWGNFRLEGNQQRLHSVSADPGDTDPSPIGQSLLDSQHPGCRIAQPCVRKGYLDRPGSNPDERRGRDSFVPVSWDEALGLAADALRRTRDTQGNQAIYGGSYGWASAGRFHHTQSQLHPFLKHFGGYTSAVQSYSTGTAHVIIPHIFGLDSKALMLESPTVDDVVAHTRLVVSFGGISMKNTQVNQGGIGNHSARAQLQRMREAGVHVICVSPVRDDVADFLSATWWPIRPNADVALMLGLAYTLHTEGLHDTEFLARYCTDYTEFADYLTGRSDGVAKDAQWAAALCDIDAAQITALARRMAAEPCLLSISWSLQRTENGEQPYWMIAMLAAMLGNIGLPGQGVGYGYGCIHNFGFQDRRKLPFRVADLPQGNNPVSTYIPVARIADMLLNPGQRYPFNGKTLTYPAIDLVYWAGGNPFHHHQDLNRLRKAWQTPGTIIVHDPFWTSTARHADIVFPSTTFLEREDFACGTAEATFTPMHQALSPYAAARDDYAIFSELAARLDFGDRFTEGRNARQWIEHLWAVTRGHAADAGHSLPDFETFWTGGVLALDRSAFPAQVYALERFRRDPVAAPLNTPSGRIEISSATIAGFGLADVGGFPRWNDKQEFIGSPRSRRFPLALNSNQPTTRLHSQFDFGRTSTSAKCHGREVIRIHPDDARTRGINDGDVVRVFNDRGACLAGAVISDRVRAGVVVLPTGAWFDPLERDERPSLEVHGNPNVLTRDVGTSTLAQGTSAHSCLVDIERFDEPLPPITVFSPPDIVTRG